MLDQLELDRFLETFYAAGSIFKGDVRLPVRILCYLTLTSLTHTAACWLVC